MQYVQDRLALWIMYNVTQGISNATVRLSLMGAEEVQQLRGCDLLDFSKDHSDPCWTGQTV